MSSASGSQRHFGEGPLARASALVYTLMVVEFLLLISIVPSLAALLLLARDASNLPLFTAAALPLGPALSSAVYALRYRHRDLIDLRPAAAFWRRYRANLWGVLRVWVPWLAWVTVIAMGLAHFGATGLPVWWAALLAIVAAASALALVNALVITSLFSFRAIDVARLAVAFLARTPGVTIGNACLLAAAAAVTALSSEAVLALLGSIFALALLTVCRPMIAGIERDFIA